MIIGLPLLRGDQGVCYGKKRGLGRCTSQSFFVAFRGAKKYLSKVSDCF